MAASVKDVKMDWAGHSLPVLKVEAGETLPTAVSKWCRGAAQATLGHQESMAYADIVVAQAPEGFNDCLKFISV